MHEKLPSFYIKSNHTDMAATPPFGVTDLNYYYYTTNKKGVDFLLPHRYSDYNLYFNLHYFTETIKAKISLQVIQTVL